MCVNMHCFFFYYSFPSFIPSLLLLVIKFAWSERHGTDSALGATEAAVNETDRLLPSCCLAIKATTTAAGGANGILRMGCFSSLLCDPGTIVFPSAEGHPLSSRVTVKCECSDLGSGKVCMPF